jgi:hypothetical protein
MSGTIGIPANDAARYTLFFACLSQLHHPPNTAVRWAFGSDRIRGRNNLVRESLEAGSEWLWFLDDDHAFAPDLLRRLLAHEVEIVTPVYLQRMMPFAPVVYMSEDPDGNFEPLFLPDYAGDCGLVEVYAAGTGGMLIRSEVFRAVPEPWFEHGHASEDLIFCEKAREAGFLIHCDVQAQLGHLTAAAIWPSYADGQWGVGFTIADQMQLRVPIGTREQLAELEAQANGGRKRQPGSRA